MSAIALVSFTSLKYVSKWHFLATPCHKFYFFVQSPPMPFSRMWQTMEWLRRNDFCTLASYANHVMSKEVGKVRNYNFNDCPDLFLHVDIHLLTNYPGKENKILPTELVFNTPFQNILRTINTRFWLSFPRDHSFSTFEKFPEKLTFLTPWYKHVHVCIRG